MEKERKEGEVKTFDEWAREEAKSSAPKITRAQYERMRRFGQIKGAIGAVIGRVGGNVIGGEGPGKGITKKDLKKVLDNMKGNLGY